MSYTPTVWQDGDVITAEKLNKLENGIESVGPVKVIFTVTKYYSYSPYVLDSVSHTVTEVRNFLKNGIDIVPELRVISEDAPTEYTIQCNYNYNNSGVSVSVGPVFYFKHSSGTVIEISVNDNSWSMNISGINDLVKVVFNVSYGDNTYTINSASYTVSQTRSFIKQGKIIAYEVIISSSNYPDYPKEFYTGINYNGQLYNGDIINGPVFTISNQSMYISTSGENWAIGISQ